MSNNYPYCIFCREEKKPKVFPSGKKETRKNMLRRKTCGSVECRELLFEKTRHGPGYVEPPRSPEQILVDGHIDNFNFRG